MRNDDQTGFLFGCFIGENYGSLYDLFHYTEKNTRSVIVNRYRKGP